MRNYCLNRIWSATMAVKPPMGTGRVRLVEIGGGDIDVQPCGGTHVASTAEIGTVMVQKIEKKGPSEPQGAHCLCRLARHCGRERNHVA